MTSQNKYSKTNYHQVGTSQQEDQLVYEDKAHPLRYNSAQVTDDGRYLFIYISEGTDGKEVWYRDLQAKNPALKRLFAGFAHNYSVVDHKAGQFLVYHNNGAPTYKVSLVDPVTGAMKDFVSAKPDKLETVTLAGGKLFAHYLKDVTTRVTQYDLKSGRLENTVALPGLGTADGFSGEKSDKVVFYRFSSFTVPPTICQYDLATQKSTIFKSPTLRYNQTTYETKQVFYTSKDGTRVPMFLTHREGLKLDGTNPTLLYGYGSYNVSLSPYYNGPLIAFLEQGGVYAVANLRGGGEYGEAWHKQGMKAKKQNVFDDCVAAAEYLIAQKYTSPEKLALQGGSNGGLLVGAVINQRPDLFRVAFPQVGVMDILRFQKFTVGWGWVVEFGSSEKPDDFKYIYAYSPLHNIRPGINYPATMVTTADHDDRVVPAHSFKYAATLQATYKGPNPVLIRIETNSGHGAVSTQKRIDENADIFSFMLWNMGMKSLTEVAEK